MLSKSIKEIIHGETILYILGERYCILEKGKVKGSGNYQKTGIGRREDKNKGHKCPLIVVLIISFSIFCLREGRLIALHMQRIL